MRSLLDLSVVISFTQHDTAAMCHCNINRSKHDMRPQPPRSSSSSFIYMCCFIRSLSVTERRNPTQSFCSVLTCLKEHHLYCEIYSLEKKKKRKIILPHESKQESQDGFFGFWLMLGKMFLKRNILSKTCRSKAEVRFDVNWNRFENIDV